MNLLTIILEYLEKCETDSQATGDAFLADLVKNAGMSRSLVKHIKACWPASKVKHLGSFLTVEKNHDSWTAEDTKDVNVWTIQVTT